MDKTTTNKEIPQETMWTALNELEARMDRMPGINWFFLYPTAKNVAKHEFLDPPISIGILNKELTKERMLVFESYFSDLQMTDNGLMGKILDVPVVIRFIKREYDFLKNPESIFYLVDYFRIPNPIDQYLEVWKSVK